VRYLQVRIISMAFQDFQAQPKAAKKTPKFILVVDMEGQANLSTRDIPDIAEKIETALPDIFPKAGSAVDHSCGGNGTEIEQHSFREEVDRGMSIPHLLEHVLLHLLSRRSNRCTAYCGQRSADLERGITTHYWLVLDYPTKLEAIIAADLGFQLVSAWVEGRTVRIDPAVVLDGLRELIEPMVWRAA